MRARKSSTPYAVEKVDFLTALQCLTLGQTPPEQRPTQPVYPIKECNKSKKCKFSNQRMQIFLKYLSKVCFPACLAVDFTLVFVKTPIAFPIFTTTGITNPIFYTNILIFEINYFHPLQLFFHPMVFQSPTSFAALIALRVFTSQTPHHITQIPHGSTGKVTVFS